MPPKEYQYKPGQSGNPNGRPKRSRNMLTIVEEELEKTVKVTENGQSQTFTKRETLAKRIVNDANNGKAHAIRILLSIIGNDPEPLQDSFITQADQENLVALLKRHEVKS